METLNKIPDTGAWSEIAAKTNDNFTKVSLDLHKLEMTTSVKMPLFSSVSDAQSKVSKPYFGQLILVGSTLPAPVYKWDGTSWVDTGLTGGDASAPLTDYPTKTEVNASLALKADKTEVEKLSNQKISGQFVVIKTTNKVTI